MFLISSLFKTFWTAYYLSEESFFSILIYWWTCNWSRSVSKSFYLIKLCIRFHRKIYHKDSFRIYHNLCESVHIICPVRVTYYFIQTETFVLCIKIEQVCKVMMKPTSKDSWKSGVQACLVGCRKIWYELLWVHIGLLL